MNRAVSIQDIAKILGVSHTTVSRALHDNPLISKEMRERVQVLALEMGYTPNALAQSLKGQRTHTVGLVVTTIADPFVGRVVRGIDEVAQSANMNVFLGISNNDPEREMAVIESFHRRRVDGIIVAAAQISNQYSKRLERINVPTVLINAQAENVFDLLYSVSVDDYQGARQAVEHLLSLGHRAIGYLGVGNRPRSNRRRMEGYLDALQAAGIAPLSDLIRTAPREHHYQTEDVTDGQALSQDLLDRGVSALFCYNDMVAIGTLLTCHERGIAVPEELSIIGFDDIELAQYVTPPLTTIHQHKLPLGQKAMEMLLDLIADRPVQNAVISTDLVIRHTTGPAYSVRQRYIGEDAGTSYPSRPTHSQP